MSERFYAYPIINHRKVFDNTSFQVEDGVVTVEFVVTKDNFITISSILTSTECDVGFALRYNSTVIPLIENATPKLIKLDSDVNEYTFITIKFE